MEACVVGGGPVGLFAAACLHQRDVPVRVVDAQLERPVRSYACGLHAATLRLFDDVGMMPALLECAHRVDRLGLHRGLERAATFDFGDLGGPFPYLLTLRQSDLQDLLTEQLAQRGVEVAWREQVTSITLGTDSVSTVAVPMSLAPAGAFGERGLKPSGDPVLRRADYVIAADGYDSFCRQVLGIQLIDLKQSEAFAMFEFEADLAKFAHEAQLVVLDDGVSAFWPLSPTVGRWSFQLSERLDETPNLEMLGEMLRARAPWFGPRPEQVHWSATAHFERRIASRFGAGRVWLAGEAAHVTSPLGFQNMNRGFIEASEIAQVLARDLEGQEAAAAGFEHFERRQRAEWRRLFGTKAHLPGTGALSNVEGARLLPCLPATGGDLDRILAQLALRAALH